MKEFIHRLCSCKGSLPALWLNGKVLHWSFEAEADGSEEERMRQFRWVMKSAVKSRHG